MRTIWKFPLQMHGWNAIPIGPAANVVLAAVDLASGLPAIWVEHDPADQVGPGRNFGLFPTGGSIAADGAHVGSLIDAPFVWHIYEQRQ